MNDFLTRLLATSQIKFENGGIYIVGVPMIMRTAYVNAYSDNLLNKTAEGRSIIFWCGYVQASLAMGLVDKKYKYKNKETSFKIVGGQMDMLGYGKFEPTRINFEKPEVVVKCSSCLAKEYLRVYGVQKNPIDHWLRGSMVAIVAKLNNVKPEELLCIETRCIAKGDPICELILKKRKEFDLKNPSVKYQIPLKTPLPSQLGQNEKIESLPTRRI